MNWIPPAINIRDKNVGLKFSFNFFNFSCLFLLFKEFTKNQEDTHLCFVTIVCEVITRTIRITAFWKRTWKYCVDDRRFENLSGSYYHSKVTYFQFSLSSEKLQRGVYFLIRGTHTFVHDDRSLRTRMTFKH